MTKTRNTMSASKPLYSELHSVVTKWDKSEMEKLRKLAASHNLKPGPFITEIFRAQLATMDVRDSQPQEALPIEKAS